MMISEGKTMSKVEFQNAPTGIVFRFKVNCCLYRLRDRISRALVMERITPQASASLVEIVKESQRGEWDNAKYMLDLDHVLSLRLAGGSYKAIAAETGWSVAKIRRVCQEEGC
jgi:hypothetical protein